MLKCFVNIVFRIAELFHCFCKLMRGVNFYFRHIVNYIFIFCAVGGAENKFKFIFIGIAIIHHFYHSLAGKLTHLLRLFLRRELCKSALRFAKHTHKRVVLLADKCVKQFFFTLKITVKCTRCHAGIFLRFCAEMPIESPFRKIQLLQPTEYHQAYYFRFYSFSVLRKAKYNTVISIITVLYRFVKSFIKFYFVFLK